MLNFYIPTRDEVIRFTSLARTIKRLERKPETAGYFQHHNEPILNFAVGSNAKVSKYGINAVLEFRFRDIHSCFEFTYYLLRGRRREKVINFLIWDVCLRLT